MKRSEFLGIIHGLQYKLGKFDLDKLVTKFKSKEVTEDQIKQLRDDIYRVEEDLIILDVNNNE